MMRVDSMRKHDAVFIFFILAVLFEICYLYQHTFIWIKTIWVRYAPDQIGISVPIIFGCIAIFRIKTHPPIPIQTDKRGLILLLLSMGVFFTGVVADINIVQAFSLILFGFGMLIYLGGMALGRIFLFMFACLFLMVPSISFLLESVLGVKLRLATAVLSGLFIKLCGGSWEVIHGARLQLGDLLVPIEYSRSTPAAPLALLIQTCMVAELLFYKNRYKFIFAVLFVPLFVLSHSIFTAIMLVVVQHGNFDLADQLWAHQGWLPALIHALFLLILSVVMKRFKLKLPLQRRLKSNEEGAYSSAV